MRFGMFAALMLVASVSLAAQESKPSDSSDANPPVSLEDIRIVDGPARSSIPRPDGTGQTAENVQRRKPRTAYTAHSRRQHSKSRINSSTGAR